MILSQTVPEFTWLVHLVTYDNGVHAFYCFRLWLGFTKNRQISFISADCLVIFRWLFCLQIWKWSSRARYVICLISNVFVLDNAKKKHCKFMLLSDFASLAIQCCYLRCSRLFASFRSLSRRLWHLSPAYSTLPYWYFVAITCDWQQQWCHIWDRFSFIML